MSKYIIDEIETIGSGYERFAKIKSLENDTYYNVSFLDYVEYIDGIEQLTKNQGDILEGDLYIAYVAIDKKVDEDIMHRYPIPKSSHIEAVVQVCEIIDEYTLYASTSLIENKILVEFEHSVKYNQGDYIHIEGSLEFNEKE